ncbi:helix-turn-helix domain-containing protein [Aminipila sp.]|uniref:helix-turn-helix domain-containing protein n=1 Tax=Aminipila sp. TaxID=2060095 RepID=UPI0028A27456|nr:helix-turn-helix domain-containing protein [Aminipila sp.]
MAKGKYEEWLTADGLLKLEAWARDGLTDEQIAHNMGVSTATLYNYKRDHIEILEALKRGKEVVDIEVENALLKRAKGYKYTEVTKELITNKETGEKELVVTKEVIKEVLPDVTAQIFWLKNRKPEWRDKQEMYMNLNATDTFDDILSQLGGKGLEE